MAETWERIARELGTCNVFCHCGEETEAIDIAPPHLGEWVEVEAACRRIEKLEADVRELVQALGSMVAAWPTGIGRRPSLAEAHTHGVTVLAKHAASWGQ